MGTPNTTNKKPGTNTTSVNPTQKLAISSDCPVSGCRTKVYKFGFCAEHYEEFKYGLITKQGKPVPDYEKKLRHYNEYKVKISARKVA